MTVKYFSEMLPVLAERARLAALSYLRFANSPLSLFLNEAFDRPFGESGAFLADPTFEATYGWETGEKSMSELAGNLLSRELVNAMDKPPRELAKDYRFGKDQRPYTHQLKAWELLSQPTPQSIVVASGTGSGKTECFMVPILDSLARLRSDGGGKLIGTRALFLYPLNALINSQRERLRAWTAAFNGDIRFCLYNGNTPESIPTFSSRDFPAEVRDRRSLRQAPPPILVTNATMLEYMLVRTTDAPILKESRGKLEWVVLDEAHTYIGSQAAEMALLIRRVLLAFGVSPKDVRFVATSATIGDPEGEAGIQLRKFMAEISGAEPERVHVVAGSRALPDLMSKKPNSNAGLDEISSIDAGNEVSTERFETLESSATAQEIRQLFLGRSGTSPVARLSQVASSILSGSRNIGPNEFEQALRWLDLLSGTRQGETDDRRSGEAFLPLRAHLFQRTFSGLWACADKFCTQKKGTVLDDEKWPFGLVYFEIRSHCRCGSPVYEIVKCDGCGEPFLMAGIDTEGTISHHQPSKALDEFELDTDLNETDDDSDVSPVPIPLVSSQNRLLIVNQDLDHVSQIYLDRETRREVEASDGKLLLFGQEEINGGLTCPNCDARDTPRYKTFLSSRIGAPYFLGSIMPTLLEYAPDGEKPADHPCRARRLLGFNDSRQGTARIAARLQQESERNRIRGLIYHLVISGKLSDKSEQLRNLSKLIADLEQANVTAPNEQLQRIIDERRKELEELISPGSVNFMDLADGLANSGSDFDHMLGLYRKMAGDTFQDRGSIELARMFLIREMGRRPKRNNNLETMGLVSLTYPALGGIDQVPRTVSEISDLNLEEWRDLLKICLDFFVRANGALEISRDWRKWLGVPFPQVFLVERDADSIGRNQQRWPRAGGPGKRRALVRLLSFALTFDPSFPEGEDKIDTILKAVWDTFCSNGILVQRPDGRVLPLEQLALSVLGKGWICPVTRRILDTTFRQITPYLPDKPTPDTAWCESVEIPIYDKPFSGVSDDLDRISIAREWLGESALVRQLREKGIWSSFHDRTIELPLYFTTAEHSAQQDSATLEYYEKRFKSGDLNLLSCSTTMEMGIDIGGISMVAMNNVPPNPANYLQRAGRAGRRREARSTSMTLCKSNPHDQSVFANSRWAFDTSLPVPRVSLDSPRIVQRQVHSFLLSQFLSVRLENTGQESLRLSCGAYFLGENSLANQFGAWARSSKTSESLSISGGIGAIVHGTIFDGRSTVSILEDAATEMALVSMKWKAEWDQLEKELSQVTEEVGIESVAARAIGLHKKRLSDEYLLRELSSRGFLPAYGFPTDIASFDNLNVVQFKRHMMDRESGRDDNRFRRRELASRDVATALREYAPGSEVVMDGLVYKSAGVTLNWHIPADQSDIKEIQEIRFASRCRKCGASSSSHSLEAAKICVECGNEIEIQDRVEFLEPAGFAVDFYDEPGNDVSAQKYIPVEDPWVDADGEWLSLPNPELGRFRVSNRGHIFHQSKGVNGFGYALCLECGRAEPMFSKDSLPPIFQKPHRRLRRSRKEGIDCSGSNNPWKIKKGISLGHEGWTDILEVQLRSADGVWLDDAVAANTICVAFRDSLAEAIGIQANELGCQIKQSRLEMGGSCRSIIIFDRYAAGYASGAETHLGNIFQSVRSRLQCIANCDSACPSCVLDYDQRFAVDRLDRHSALRFLTETWTNSLSLPDSYAYFGAESKLEPHNLSESIWRTLVQKGSSGIRLFASGNKSEWDIAPSTLRELAYRLGGRGMNVEVVIPGSLEGVSDDDRYVLASLSDHPQIEIRTCSEPIRAKNAYVIAETIHSPSTRWATDFADAMRFDSGWGSAFTHIVRTDMGAPSALPGEVLSTEQIRPTQIDLGDKEIDISNELDGPISHFGLRFWEKVCSEHKASSAILESGEDSITRIVYSDRYLFTPISIAVLYEIVKGLKNRLGASRWSDVVATIRTASKGVEGERWNSNKLWSDWTDDSTRIKVAQLLFQNLGTDLLIDLFPNNALEHGRLMEIELASGKRLSLRFDQGVGYWKTSQTANKQLTFFNFQRSTTEQCSQLKGLTIRVEGREMPTQIFVRIK